MQAIKSEQTAVSEVDRPDEVQKNGKLEELNDDCSGGNAYGDSILDVSGQSLDFSVSKRMDDSVEGLYMYKNVYNLIPRWLGGHQRLKTLKYFGNEVNLFPAEFSNLVELECLQLKMSAPSLTGLPLDKMKALKELELSQVPPRPSAFTLLSKIAGLRCLKKLSVTHFSIRYLPPEIGCLTKLEYLDLSFNKMRSLPTEITYLSDLISLKVSNNKLVELPSDLSNLQRLENLDVSNNRLATLGSLDLGSMPSLQKLNLQYNKLISCQIPSWICCNMEGNGEKTSSDGLVNAAVEMDVFEDNLLEFDNSAPPKSTLISSSSHLTVIPSSSRSFAARRPGKGWKRRYYLQQRARQERLNCSRKLRCEDHADSMSQNSPGNCKQCEPSILPEVNEKSSSSQAANIGSKETHSGEAACEITSIKDDDISPVKEPCDDICSCVPANSVEIDKVLDNDCTECDTSLDAVLDSAQLQDEESLPALCSSTPKSKRHSDRDLDNPKPSKYRRPAEHHLDLCCKYSSMSFCGTDDHLPDGFYDAGRDRPFTSLRNYEQYLHLDSREVILLDRNRDEDLDAIVLCAKSLVSRFMKTNNSTGESELFAVDNLQIASLLALFVSDHFGGSDRSAVIEKLRKAVSGSNYRKPFVCSCPTGNRDSVRKSIKHGPDTSEDVAFLSLCERGLQSIKAKRDSIVVPIGTLQFGVCRHRALLMKYLCDRMEPRVPCELVRGYLDFSPHAWNIIAVRSGDAWVRMIVDACHPHDIRQETDPEYYCRYIPLSRISVPHLTESSPEQSCSFPSLSACDEIEKMPSSSLLRCDVGSVEAVAKVRYQDIDGISLEEIKQFEYSCLGEVRILSALSKHSCIVELYGHQISSKWVQSLDKDTKHRKLQTAILMEYIRGGSLKNYIKKLSEGGEKHVQVELALYIARDIASALVELHSKHIIHRDIKSENILIDLDRRRPDGTPLVKLCDFDRAVPLRSYLHSCCIAHNGIPPPNVCVGTPRWMAPEVFRAMHDPDMYGLEVDIWSFGCLLLELLTLKVPYSGMSELEINDYLRMGKRPPLPDDIEVLGLPGETEMAQTGSITEEELEVLKFLSKIYRRCTVNNPIDRPTAENLYDMLHDRTTSFIASTTSSK